jgi:hypothetical protein
MKNINFIISFNLITYNASSMGALASNALPC